MKDIRIALIAIGYTVLFCIAINMLYELNIG